ncbi:MAG: macro domain-containing protein [Paraprevotella sp.]|nr:macro domain-containing protein [Paraprevotella sp.]
MGAGIALQFLERYPDMCRQYVELCRKGLFRPGYVFDYVSEKGHVYNLATQQTWAPEAKLPYIRRAMQTMMKKAAREGVSAIALPAIGAGLGGLDWNDVKAVMEEVASKYPSVDLFVVEKYGRGRGAAAEKEEK